MAESGNSYILREFNLGDYNKFSSWWQPDKPPPADSLPIAGLVSGDMKAAGFLANTDTDFGIVTWWQANPKNKGKESYLATKEVIKGLVDIAVLNGKKNVFVYTQRRGMIRLLESLGFNDYNGHLILRLK